ncbi:hypothetical protein FKB34_01925 [Glycocaulis profundi]|nr:hypothetical protein FKB34_01925 [Glycocaulis profundi]
MSRTPASRIRSDADYRALKAATARAIRDNGSAEAFARETRGVGESLRNWQRHSHESFIPADVIADAESGAERPYITEVLARMQGWILVPGPEVVDASGADYAAMKEAGEAVAAIAEALSHGGRIDRAEAPGVLKEIREAIAALAAEEAALVRAFPEHGPAVSSPCPPSPPLGRSSLRCGRAVALVSADADEGAGVSGAERPQGRPAVAPRGAEPTERSEGGR